MNPINNGEEDAGTETVDTIRRATTEREKSWFALEMSSHLNYAGVKFTRLI